MDKQIKVQGFTEEQVDLIKRTIAPSSTMDELELFLAQCNRTGLDPLTRQIWFIKVDNKVVIQASIDGLRAIAERSSSYAGQDAPEFKAVKTLDGKADIQCSVRVYRFNEGQRYQASVGVAYFSESKPAWASRSPSSLWNTKPKLMLAKVAESLALRKAFPNDLSGIYTPEEFAQSTTASERTVPVSNPPHKEETPIYSKSDDDSISWLSESEERSTVDEDDLQEVFSVDSVQVDKGVRSKHGYYAYDNCPRCEDGKIVIKRNKIKNTQFLACSNYPKCDFSDGLEINPKK